MKRLSLLLSTLSIFSLLACGGAPTKAPQEKIEGPTLDHALVFSLAVLKKGPGGRPIPQPARLGFLRQAKGEWIWSEMEDPDSNVFHKAMFYQGSGGEQGLLTAGGTKAIVKLWKIGGEAETLWAADFGGKFSRMRDIEVGDIYGDGIPAIAVATHDQGVVACLRLDVNGAWSVNELDRQPNTVVHEVELGDLDGDGILEIYATPSLPNKLDGSPQPGEVVRYIPAKNEKRTVVADLGDRHAKEILVGDVDGDGRDELYASLEAVNGGQVEILRFDEGSDPGSREIIARLPDTLCRFLTAGDLDGDGREEMIAAAHKSGLWLLKPGEDPHQEWQLSNIDQNSGGFEHAALITDLDQDGTSELYVANDKGKEINRYQWKDGAFEKTTLYNYPSDLSGFTWNIMPVPSALIPTSP